MVEEIEKIIKQHLPKFWSSVVERPNVFDGRYIAIKMAAKDYLINGVEGQRPQSVSLSLDLNTMVLKPQVFGGNGGNCIYRKPNLSDPKEKYLAMKSVKIPFRTPQPNEKAILKAIEMFCIRYKEALAENFDVLCYQEYMNYDEVLN